MRGVKWVRRREQQILLLISFGNIVNHARRDLSGTECEISNFLFSSHVALREKLWMFLTQNKGKLGGLISK